MSIEFNHTSSPVRGAKLLTEALIESLNAGKKVLWLIAGGSNIQIAVEIMKNVRKAISKEALSRLIVSETDERYGPVGHPDSNWQQMVNAGFNFKHLTALHILRNASLEDTSAGFAADLEKAFSWADVTIAQFGIGPDGHIAGILPHSPAVQAASLVIGYESEPFTRVTMTFPAIERVTAAYAFVFGDSKREAVRNLKTADLPVNEQPAQILKKLREAHIYSDQV